MKKILYILLCSLAVACTSFDGNPYDGTVRTAAVRLVYPTDYAAYLRAGVKVTLSDRNTNNVYSASTDASGRVEFKVAAGHYRLSVLDKADAESVFNGVVEQVDLAASDASLDVALKFTKPGTLIIKEFYFGGCAALPAEGNYTFDRYLILHNNDLATQYLDNICVGMVDPYNSTSTSGNYWTTVVDGQIVYRDYASVPDCVWQLGGSGTDFPLAPGADAVIVLNGAVDHTQQYPLSVNLNRAGYFVCYDLGAYNQSLSARYHPTPGDQILESHYLTVKKKTGTATSATFAISLTSPAVIVYRAPAELDFQAYLDDSAQSVIARGSSNYTRIPWSWVIDGMEAFSQGSANNAKRLHPDIDAGAVSFSAPYLGHTVCRRLDEISSAAAGIDVYEDTNNSANDFYERETQSLHE